MFLTIELARLPCCTTFSRLPRSMSVNSATSARRSSPTSMVAMICCNSSMRSVETDEKLLTKLSGFLIS